ncbi:hypothetical protein [Sulfurimicrobium lacus]|uniref:hypothetical protein n=1 Tax=Sulfurimicrobium lacus TaxID=2715678 RepID=UPI001566E367|nr:hypothetical protein [Sulfurimicrobium lacus]
MKQRFAIPVSLSPCFLPEGERNEGNASRCFTLMGAQPVAIILPAAMKIDTGKSRIGGKALLFAHFPNRPDQRCMRFMKVAIHLFPRVCVLLAW